MENIQNDNMEIYWAFYIWTNVCLMGPIDNLSHSNWRVDIYWLLPDESQAITYPPFTHWGRNKMAAISADNILKSIFVNENV